MWFAHNDWLQPVNLSLCASGCRNWRKCDRISMPSHRISFGANFFFKWVDVSADSIRASNEIYVNANAARRSQMRWKKHKVAQREEKKTTINSRYIKHSVIHFVKYDHDLMSECLSFVSHEKKKTFSVLPTYYYYFIGWMGARCAAFASAACTFLFAVYSTLIVFHAEVRTKVLATNYVHTDRPIGGCVDIKIYKKCIKVSRTSFARARARLRLRQLVIQLAASERWCAGFFRPSFRSKRSAKKKKYARPSVYRSNAQSMALLRI